MPTKHNLREVLLFCFNLKKSVADDLIAVLCIWGTCFINTSNKEREGSPIKFQDAEFEAILDQDSCLNQEELAGTLRVTQQTILNRLKAMSMMQKQGNWVPNELMPRNIERRFFMCEQLLQSLNRKGFLH